MRSRLLAAVVAMTAVVGLTSAVGAGASRAPATRTTAAVSYVVVFKDGRAGAGARAVRALGGQLRRISKIGVATVTSSNPVFLRKLRASSAVVGVTRNAGFFQPALKRRHRLRRARRRLPTRPLPARRCTASRSPSGPIRSARASGTCGPSAPHRPARTRSTRARASRSVTSTPGIDLTHPDLTPNLDVAESCSFIYATTPTSDPAEQVTPGDCSNKAAVQDLAGHGTHTAGTIAAPINGMGIAGVAPQGDARRA